MSETLAPHHRARKRPYISATIVLLAGLFFLVAGLQLLQLRGSAYYIVASLPLLASAVLLFRRRRSGYILYAAFLVATAVWALAEAGFVFWPLFARLGAPLVVAVGMALPWLWRRFGAPRLAVGTLLVLLLGAAIWAVTMRLPNPDDGPVPAVAQAPSDWATYGGDLGASRFSTLGQIGGANVGRLERAWVYRTGDLPGPNDKQTAWTFETTPLQVGNRLFLCTAHTQVHAIDATTGRRLWMYDPKASYGWSPLKACRGVAYYAMPDDRAGSGECRQRIFSPVVDGSLQALDALTGRPCPGFGQGGRIDLKQGLGGVRPGYYFTTSAPLVVDDKVIVGANVMDGAEVGEPSGVIRAFDAVTGKLAWAWDLGADDRAAINREDPDAGDYARGTPNAWAPLTADARNNLLFVPLGNPTPDFFGGGRKPVMERFGSSLVALDTRTGQLRWAFQTIHHDLWDQDLPAQPSLIDFPTGRGTVPALVQPTKRGELFILNRLTGKPLTRVEERPSPGGAVPGDFTAPTQPYSVGMPSLVGPRLTEASAWGMTPIDQLICRIKYRQLRYEGPLTPPSMQGTISYPGSAGVVSWGGVTIDRQRGILIVNTSHTPFKTTLIPRAKADAMGLSRAPNSTGAGQASRGSPETKSGADAGLPQVGTPYAAQAVPFLSPLFVPCIQPPWGRISAIDLKTRKLLWQHPFGTSSDTGPLGMKAGLPLPIGVFNTGGSVALSSGIFFIAAAQDRYLRAYESATGRELWRSRLPAGGQATPMTYYSPASKRQYVVVAAGGHAGMGTQVGDYVIAYRLP